MSDYPFEWREDEHGQLVPYGPDEQGNIIKFAWAPQEGSQTAYLESPIYETLYEGTRGPGKTDGLLMDYGQEVGKGWGADWSGIIFRQSYKQLEDLAGKALKWFPKFFPKARWNASDFIWTFPEGETLRLRYMERATDYYNYHGHAYPFIGWEELTTWATSECYLKMMSCSRSTRKGIPIKYRGTTNPYGIGHGWVKDRFELPLKPNNIIGDVIEFEMEDPITKKPIISQRVAIHGDLSENKILLHADPGYPARISQAASNEAERKAWLFGDWDVVAGGMFDDIWFNCKDNIIVSDFKIPNTWKVTRSFDWGSARPFSVGWWVESDGSDLTFKDGRTISTVPGDLFRIREWYGWTGEPNQGCKMLAQDIAAGIVEREIMWNIHDKVIGGVADSSIFSVEDGHSIAGEMEKVIRLPDGKVRPGIEWSPADKRPGSRAQGWEVMRKMFASTKPKGGPREDRGLFVVDHCKQFLRTVPTIARSTKNLDDVNTEAEDHIADESRYRVRWEQPVFRVGRTKGLR